MKKILYFSKIVTNDFDTKIEKIREDPSGIKIFTQNKIFFFPKDISVIQTLKKIKTIEPILFVDYRFEKDFYYYQKEGKVITQKYYDISFKKKAKKTVLQLKSILSHFKNETLWMPSQKDILEKDKELIQRILPSKYFSWLYSNLELFQNEVAHGDIRYHNFIIKDNKIKIIDVERCGLFSPSYDLLCLFQKKRNITLERPPALICWYILKGLNKTIYSRKKKEKSEWIECLT